MIHHVGVDAPGAGLNVSCQDVFSHGQSTPTQTSCVVDLLWSPSTMLLFSLSYAELQSLCTSVGKLKLLPLRLVVVIITKL